MQASAAHAITLYCVVCIHAYWALMRSSHPLPRFDCYRRGLRPSLENDSTDLAYLRYLKLVHYPVLYSTLHFLISVNNDDLLRLHT